MIINDRRGVREGASRLSSRKKRFYVFPSPQASAYADSAVRASKRARCPTRGEASRLRRAGTGARESALRCAPGRAGSLEPDVDFRRGRLGRVRRRISQRLVSVHGPLTKPEPDVVTGVSTGALISPFA